LRCRQWRTGKFFAVLGHAVAQETIKFTFWKQKVSQRAVRPEQAPCDQSVHSWNRQAAKIGSGWFEFESPDYFGLSRRGSERLSSALRLALRSFFHEHTCL
jgi:hypothetical protein